MAATVGERTYTKSELLREFASDELELNETADYEAEQMGISVKEFARRIAIVEFDTMLGEGSIVKVGNRYKLR